MTRAATVPIYRPDGDLYDQISRFAMKIAGWLFRPAVLCFAVILGKARVDQLDERLTDEAIQQEIYRDYEQWLSLRLIQYGLFALEYVAKVITREPSHGRRIIKLTRGLRDKPPDRAARSSPCTPSEEKEKSPITTIEAPSSSSPDSASEKTEEPDQALVRSLLERARKLVNGATFGAICKAVKDYSADWVRKALDEMERRNKRPGALRKDWGYVLGILRTWRERGDAPEDPAPPAAETREKERAKTREKERAEHLANTARIDILRAKWDLLPESERESIRAAVRAKLPEAGRLPATMFEQLCLDELEQRQAEKPRAP
jgi:hypothetical protein